MPFVLDENSERSLVRLEGDVNIVEAEELKILLVRVSGTKKELCVSLEGVTDLDITAMQLLVATERDAVKCNVRFRIEGLVPNHICLAMAHAGFRRFPAP